MHAGTISKLYMIHSLTFVNYRSVHMHKQFIGCVCMYLSVTDDCPTAIRYVAEPELEHTIVLKIGVTGSISGVSSLYGHCSWRLNTQKCFNNQDLSPHKFSAAGLV